MALTERLKHYDLRPFPYKIHIIVTNDFSATRQKWSRTLGAVINESSAALALTATNGEWSEAYILLKDTATINEIAHEVTHAVLAFIRYIEATIEDEMLAYYIGWLTDGIVKFVNKK